MHEQNRLKDGDVNDVLLSGNWIEDLIRYRGGKVREDHARLTDPGH